MSRNSQDTTKMIAQTALFAALCYVGFQFLRIDVPLGPTKTAFHLGNAFLVTAALLLGGLQGGLAGAIGLTIADFTSGFATSAPKTFLMKLIIGLIIGLVAHKIGHLSERKEPSKQVLWSLLGALAGMVFNVIVDPILSYLNKRYLLGMIEASADFYTKWTATTTLVNAVFAVVIGVLLYNALVPLLRKAQLTIKIK